METFWEEYKKGQKMECLNENRKSHLDGPWLSKL